MKLLEDIKDLGDDVHAAIHAMIVEMFREDLDEDVIDEIVSNLGLSDLLALDRAYTEGDQEAVRKIIGPLPQLEYSMGRQASSMASNRPQPGRVEKPQAKDKEAPAKDVTQTNRNYNQGAANAVTTQNIDDEDPDAVMQDPEEPVEETSKHDSVDIALRNMAEKYQAAMAGMYHEDPDEILADMHEMADAFGYDISDYLENPYESIEEDTGDFVKIPLSKKHELEKRIRELGATWMQQRATTPDGETIAYMDPVDDDGDRIYYDYYAKNGLLEENNVTDMVEWLKRRAGIA